MAASACPPSGPPVARETTGNHPPDRHERDEGHAQRGRPHGQGPRVRCQFGAGLQTARQLSSAGRTRLVAWAAVGRPGWSARAPDRGSRRICRSRPRRGADLQTDDPRYGCPAEDEDQRQPRHRIHEAGDARDRERGQGRENEGDQGHPPRPRLSKEGARSAIAAATASRAVAAAAGAEIDEVDEHAERGHDERQLAGSIALLHSRMVRNRVQSPHGERPRRRGGHRAQTRPGLPAAQAISSARDRVFTIRSGSSQARRAMAVPQRRLSSSSVR